MRSLYQSRAASRMSKGALCVLMAGLAAGCSANSVRFSGEPMFAGSTAPAATAPVNQQSLPPIAYNATPAPDTLAALRTRGWSVDEGKLVTVGQGDTATTLSQGFGVPVSVILEANGLQREDEVRVGRRLVIPKYVLPEADPAAGTAIASDAQTLGAPPTTLADQAREGRHVVQDDQTLYSIARAHRVSVSELARLNGRSLDYKVKIGETLRIPASGTPAETQVAAVEPKAEIAPPTMTDATLEPIASAPQATEPSPPAPEADAAKASEGTKFSWPVQGRLVTGFGKQADGARNHGINVSVPAGTPVHAAESGTVIYAGDELEGYGNLVLVQHADDWVSAYAHNETLKVSRGDKVSRGQPIASVGTSGSVDEPQLHFELRKKSEPVDPLPHLQS